MERRAILSETAATLAHEIRNPLNLINLTADHIGTQFKPQDPSQDRAYQELITSLKAEVKHLNHMVNEFLAIGKPIKIVRTKFRFDDLLDQVSLLVRQHLVDKNITLRTDIPAGLVIEADLEQMRLVVLNLVLNAVEVSQSYGIITITAFVEEEGRCRITVADNGPGIDPADCERIFEPYFTKRHDGTGLGLALARRIVEEHNGRIVARNLLGKGACFEITLPQDA
jgi:signal transduction histidine kinase